MRPSLLPRLNETTYGVGRRPTCELGAVVRPWINNVHGVWLRVESPITHGFPDIIGTNKENVAFVECKVAKSINQVKIRKRQVEFLSEWPNTWIFALINESFYLSHGKNATLTNPFGNPVAVYHGSPRWTEISKIVWKNDC